MSWRRCTNAGRCVRPEAGDELGVGIAEGHVAVFGVAEHAARDELVAGHDERGAAVGVAEHLEDPLRDRDVRARPPGRGGRITRQRWNIVDQSSSVRVWPLLLVSLIEGSGFFGMRVS